MDSLRNRSSVHSHRHRKPAVKDYYQNRICNIQFFLENEFICIPIKSGETSAPCRILQVVAKAVEAAILAGLAR